jgi:hypothetical protein
MFADSSAGADHPLENLEAAGEPPAIPAASGRVCFEPLTVEQADGVVAISRRSGFLPTHRRRRRGTREQAQRVECRQILFGRHLESHLSQNAA